MVGSCKCDWDDSDKYTNKLSSQLFRFKYTGAEKIECFRKVVKNSLSIPDYLDKKCYWVASHHWNSKFLKLKQQISKPYPIYDAHVLGIAHDDNLYIHNGNRQYFAPPDQKEEVVKRMIGDIIINEKHAHAVQQHASFLFQTPAITTNLYNQFQPFRNSRNIVYHHCLFQALTYHIHQRYHY